MVFSLVSSATAVSSTAGHPTVLYQLVSSAAAVSSTEAKTPYVLPVDGELVDFVPYFDPS